MVRTRARAVVSRSAANGQRPPASCRGRPGRTRPTIRVRLPSHAHRLPHRHLAARCWRTGHARPRLRGFLRDRGHSVVLSRWATASRPSGRWPSTWSRAERPFPVRYRLSLPGLPARTSGRRRLRDRDLCRRRGRVDRHSRSSQSSSPTPPSSARGATASSAGRRGVPARPGRTARGAEAGCATSRSAGPADRRAEPRTSPDRRLAGVLDPEKVEVLVNPAPPPLAVQPEPLGPARSSSSAGSHAQKALPVAARRAGARPGAELDPRRRRRRNAGSRAARAT